MKLLKSNIFSYNEFITENTNQKKVKVWNNTNSVYDKQAQGLMVKYLDLIKSKSGQKKLISFIKKTKQDYLDFTVIVYFPKDYQKVTDLIFKQSEKDAFDMALQFDDEYPDFLKYTIHDNIIHLKAAVDFPLFYDFKGDQYDDNGHLKQEVINNSIDALTHLLSISLTESKKVDIALDNLSSVGTFYKLRDIDKLALMGGTDDERLKQLSLTNIFRENGGTFGDDNILIRVLDSNDQPIFHKFSQDHAGCDGILTPYIHYDDEPYVLVDFNGDKCPILIDNMYPIDINFLK